MSASMYARRPPDEQPRGEHISRPLHGLIAQRLFDHDGSSTDRGVISAGDVNLHWLIGVRDGTTDVGLAADVDKILALVVEHGAVELVIER